MSPFLSTKTIDQKAAAKISNYLTTNKLFYFFVKKIYRFHGLIFLLPIDFQKADAKIRAIANPFQIIRKKTS